MALFSYKNYSDSQSADLASLAHTLSMRAMVKNASGLSGSNLVDEVGNGMNGVKSVALPAGWSIAAPAKAGFGSAYIDDDGFLQMIAPGTSYAGSGPQFQLFEQKNAAGQVTGLSIAFLGTNSVEDVSDYTQLNSGAASAAMGPALSLIRAYALSRGLSGEDVLITGHSLGGAYANVLARHAGNLAGGFFAGSDYVTHASPLVYDGNERVLNIGYEDDIVFRILGDHGSFWSAMTDTGFFSGNPDHDYASATDNFVLFNSSYADGSSDGSLYNSNSWTPHLASAVTDAIERVAESSFYKLTDRDSVVVVSDLGSSLRGKYWVEDRDHAGTPGFVIGTRFADRLADGAGNDWIDGGAGKDLIRVSTGDNRVDGGEGRDMLRVTGDPEDFTAYRLSSREMVLVGEDGITLAANIEDVEFVTQKGDIVPYSIKGNRLEDDHPSAGQQGDHDLVYGAMARGSNGNNKLVGNVVFGRNGDDRITGTNADDLLVGGEGNDRLAGGKGADRLYGNEGDDRLTGDSDGDRLNGGHGDDLFIFTAGATGEITVEDFNSAANEGDRLVLTGADLRSVLNTATADGGDLLIHYNDLTIRLENTDQDDLGSSGLLLA
ncbi:MAG: hypothetical protein ACK5LJ_01440 [Paracoccus sp. (in: a-proteobacteria)]